MEGIARMAQESGRASAFAEAVAEHHDGLVRLAGDEVLAFGGRANPENGYVAGPPPSAWIGTLGTSSD